MKMKMKVLTGLSVLLLLTAGYFLFTGQGQVPPVQAQKRESPPVEVTVHTIKQEEMIVTKDLSGRTSACQIAEIRPQVSGIVLDRLFTEGGTVTKGQQLYQIDPATYQATHDSTLAGLVQAQANAAVTVAKANVATAKINLAYTRVFAPISGRIGRSSVTKGALVTAGQATALATVQNLTQIDVYFQIGLLTTIGLAAKNAILIVEFAKDLHEKGHTIVEAAMSAAEQRLRPILMTSLAFILGVTP